MTEIIKCEGCGKSIMILMEYDPHLCTDCLKKDKPKKSVQKGFGEFV